MGLNPETGRKAGQEGGIETWSCIIEIPEGQAPLKSIELESE